MKRLLLAAVALSLLGSSTHHHSINHTVSQGAGTIPQAARSTPVLQGVGNLSGTADNVSILPPVGWAAGDLHVTFVENGNDGAITGCDDGEPKGPWIEARSPVQVGAGCPSDPGCTQIAVFYRIAQAGGHCVLFSQAGNHIDGVTIGFEAGTFDAADPIGDVSTGSYQEATQAISCPGFATEFDNSYILVGVGFPADGSGGTTVSGEANSVWETITEHVDQQVLNGDGGGYGAIYGGEQLLAGDSGTVTATGLAGYGDLVRPCLGISVNGVLL